MAASGQGGRRRRGPAAPSRSTARTLRVRRLARRRCALEAAGARDGQEEARGPAAANPADRLRPRALRRALGLRLAERRRATGGRAGVPADRPVSVVRAVRGAAPQEVKRALLWPLRPRSNGLRSTSPSRVDSPTLRMPAPGLSGWRHRRRDPGESGVTSLRSPGVPYDPAHPSCPDSGKARQRSFAAHPHPTHLGRPRGPLPSHVQGTVAAVLRWQHSRRSAR